MYLTQCLHRGVRAHPDRIVTVEGQVSRSWADWSQDVARFAGALHSIGLEAGDRVAIVARNGPGFVDTCFGTFWAGGVINPVNFRLAPAEITYSIDNCQAGIVILDPEFAALEPEIRDRAPCVKHVLIMGSNDWQAWLAKAEPVADAVRSGDDLAAIMYTGGTTGAPKGVMLSHRNLIASALGVIAAPDGRTGERFLHTAPLFHVGGFSGLLMALICGSTNIFLPLFEPVSVMAEVERLRATEIFLVPTMMRMLIDHERFGEFDLSSLERIRYGASSIDQALMERLLVAFPSVKFSQAYGMTELAPTALSLDPADHYGNPARLRSAGRATPATEVRIVDADQNELPRGEIGEIICRGEGVMLGYWNLPEATAEVKRNGWMHTGDLGQMDEDGYVTVVDRLKDMIVTGGENVYSAEVENVLSTHPAIASVAVIGLPDPRWGEMVCAVIIERPGMKAELDDIARHTKQFLAGYKIPRRIEIVESMPQSAAGKVLKNELRADLVQKTAQ
ncbi:acyl-CoA synthetase [Croceicoccus sediminis]|uniref:acyl-CoA synthetase n=1 Tax=Croceicoccus sediminis TaxID=2571150 RepID=UPI001184641E|nr:long-chain fatty acid--CoA ligase [Croceicoccus sediminis]